MHHNSTNCHYLLSVAYLLVLTLGRTVLAPLGRFFTLAARRVKNIK
jgi:hypothetical protein